MHVDDQSHLSLPPIDDNLVGILDTQHASMLEHDHPASLV